MRTVGGHTRIDWRDPRYARISTTERAWLERQLGNTPNIDDVNQLVDRPGLSRAERSIALAFKQTILGGGAMRAAPNGKLVTKESFANAVDLRASTLRAARTPSGETERETKVRTELSPALIGHEDQLDLFVEMTRRFESKVRETPVFAPIVGSRSHGKEQALEAYAKLLFGEKAILHTVDLDLYPPGAARQVFAEDGPLGVATLANLQDPALSPDGPDDKEPEYVGGVVRILNFQSLRTTKPEIAAGLMKLLQTQRKDPAFRDVQYFFDDETAVTQFDDAKKVKEAARQSMVDALGATGSRHTLSMLFRHLTPESMGRYAEPLLKNALAIPDQGDIAVAFEPDAFKLLCEVLATRYQPLEELSYRLYEMVSTKFDTHTSVDRAKGVLRISVAREIERSPSLRKELVTALHEEYADVALGHQLFVVAETQRRVDGVDQRKVALAYAAELVETLSLTAIQMAMGAPTNDPVALDAVTALAVALQSLSMSFERDLSKAKKLHELGDPDLIAPESMDALRAALLAAEEALGAVQGPAGHRLDPTWRATLAKAVRGWLDATRYALNELESTSEETPS